MEEINKILTNPYFYDSKEESLSKTKNEIIAYLEGDLSNSQSEYEFDINKFLSKKYEKNNENLKQKPILDINTMESIRISHSLEKSKKSQSLADIINEPFIKAQRNSRDENLLNQTIKFKNSNTITENENSFNSNKCLDYNSYNDNIEKQYSLISIKDEKNSDINIKNISNKSNKIQNIIEIDDNNEINNKFTKKNNKIGNIFNKIFEEKIKLMNKDIASTKKYLKYNCLKDTNKIKQKLFDHKNNVNYLSLNDSDHYSSSNLNIKNKEKDKELTIELNYNNKEKEIKDKSLQLKNRKNRLLTISRINSFNDNNIENMKKEKGNEKKLDNLKNKNKNININREKKNHIILDLFENENEDNSGKNVVISELDIKISNVISKEEKDVKNSSKEKAEANKSINSTNDEECIKEKSIFLNRKNVYTDFNKNKRKPNKIINYIYKKAFKFNKNLDKIVEKKISSYKIIKTGTSNKGKKFLNFENDISEKYKSNSPFPIFETKTIIQKKKILNNSSSNYSFFILNNSILNRKNINNKNINTERNKINYSRILNISSSISKNKRIKKKIYR